MVYWPSANELVCMIFWLWWGATNTSDQESTWGCVPLNKSTTYHRSVEFFSKMCVWGGGGGYGKAEKKRLFLLGKKTKLFLKVLKKICLLGCTSSGTVSYQIPLLNTTFNTHPGPTLLCHFA